MGAFTDCNICAECNEEIVDNARVVVTTITAGNYKHAEGIVEYDNYDIDQTIHHEICHQNMGKAKL